MDRSGESMADESILEQTLFEVFWKNEEINPEEWAIPFIGKEIQHGYVYPATRVATWPSDLESQERPSNSNRSKHIDDRGYLVCTSLDGTHSANIYDSDGLMVFFPQSSFESTNSREILDQIDAQIREITQHHRKGAMLPSISGSINIPWTRRVDFQKVVKIEELREVAAAMVVIFYGSLLIRRLS